MSGAGRHRKPFTRQTRKIVYAGHVAIADRQFAYRLVTWPKLQGCRIAFTAQRGCRKMSLVIAQLRNDLMLGEGNQFGCDMQLPGEQSHQFALKFRPGSLRRFRNYHDQLSSAPRGNLLITGREQ